MVTNNIQHQLTVHMQCLKLQLYLYLCCLFTTNNLSVELDDLLLNGDSTQN